MCCGSDLAVGHDFCAYDGINVLCPGVQPALSTDELQTLAGRDGLTKKRQENSLWYIDTILILDTSTSFISIPGGTGTFLH